MRIIVAILLLLLWNGVALGAHPLITDDAGTLGAGKAQLEFNGEYVKDDGDSATEIAVVLTAGLRKNVDLVLSVPYQFLRFTGGVGERITEDGISDMGVELKWMFYEKESLSFVIKPGVTLPSGDEGRGLGDGKASYSLMLISTKAFDSSAAHLNIGYTRNRAELRDIWHFSIAAEYAVVENLMLVGNIGVETNPDSGSDTLSAFVLGGLIYSFTEDLDIDAGVKAGLNEADADYAVLLGLTVRL